MLELSPQHPHFSPAARVLSAGKCVSEAGIRKIEDLQSNVVTCEAGHHIIHVDDPMEAAFILRRGWVARQKTLSDGRVHITHVFLPGDIFSAHLGFSRWSAYDYVALTECEYAFVAPGDLRGAAHESHEVRAALDWNIVRALDSVSENAVGIALQRASVRILRHLLDFWCRLMLVSEADESGFHLPISQGRLAELSGLSVVSTNRAFRHLREAGVIEMQDRWISFPDPRAAFDLCDFDGRPFRHFQPSTHPHGDGPQAVTPDFA